MLSLYQTTKVFRWGKNSWSEAIHHRHIKYCSNLVAVKRNEAMGRENRILSTKVIARISNNTYEGPMQKMKGWAKSKNNKTIRFYNNFTEFISLSSFTIKNSSIHTWPCISLNQINMVHVQMLLFMNYCAVSISTYEDSWRKWMAKGHIIIYCTVGQKNNLAWYENFCLRIIPCNWIPEVEIVTLNFPPNICHNHGFRSSQSLFIEFYRYLHIYINST